jgi:hypothetical protein
MRKSLIAAALIAAGVFAWYKFGASQNAAQLAALEYVPADTALFSGQLEPVDLPSYLSSIGMGPQYYNAASLAQLDEMLAGAQSASEKFVFALGRSYLAALATPAEISAKTGIKTQMRSLLYMVGLAPVLKVELGDEAAFWAMFDAIEQQSGLAHSPQLLNEQKYRQYQLSHEELTVDFLVSVKDGWATLVLTSAKLDPSHLAIALGTEKPAQNLATTKYVQHIIKKYELAQGSVGYVSSVELSKVLTSKDGNRLAKDVELLVGTEAGVALAPWREASCQTDVAAIATSWPGLFAANHFEIGATGTKVHSKLLIPTENTAVVGALQQLQGFIPAGFGDITAPAALLQLGIGLDVGQLSGSVGKLWDTLTTTQYQCAPLVEWQTALKQNNPLPMLMMAGMAAGVQGVSLQVNQLEFDAVQQVPTAADALVVLSATNVKQLFDSVKALQPGLAAVELPAAGETLALADKIPELAMFGIKPSLMASEHHLMIFSGDKAQQQAKDLSAQPLNKAGMLAFGMDYQQFFGVLKNTLASTGEPVPAELEQMMQSNMQVGLQMKMVPQGILLQSTMQMAK